mmetsp:Transcript_16947/g.19255  ORF Transcript_16947/g.19255 Transcript_16947/m.19255 type:complete len:183 (-) Transcript_16947:47-595(-)
MKVIQLLSILAISYKLGEAKIYFDRTIEEANGVSLDLTFQSGCTAKDTYGSNKCSFEWGDSVSGEVSAKLAQDLEQGSEIEINLKIDRFIPFYLKCPVCGGECKVKIPIVEKEYDIPLPPCPVPAMQVDEPFSFDLPLEAPVDVSATVSGEITLIDSTGNHVVKAHVNGKLSENRVFRSSLE